MKNLRKKLFLSILAVAFAVVSLGTSTFAWFAMNDTVSATGMQVTVKSNSTYLLIGTGNDDTAAEIQAKNPAQRSVALTIAAAESKVFPSAHTDSVTNTSTAETESNWYYKTANDPSASTSTSAPVGLSDFEGYVLHKIVFITLAKGAEPAANLKVQTAAIAANNTATGDAKTFAAVKVLVTSSSAYAELDSTNNSSATVLAASVTDAAVVQLDIWIYYDGNHSSVFTNNIANLEGATIDLTFNVELA